MYMYCVLGFSEGAPLYYMYDEPEGTSLCHMYCVLGFPEGTSLYYMYDVLGSLREPPCVTCSVFWGSLREPPCITCMM